MILAYSRYLINMCCFDLSPVELKTGKLAIPECCHYCTVKDQIQILVLLGVCEEGKKDFDKGINFRCICEIQ